MTPNRTLLWLVCLGCLACGANPSPPDDTAVRSKPGAPVDIDGTATLDQARLTITFRRPARNLDVRVSGIDGLVLESDPNPVRAGSFREGQELELTLHYRAGSAHANLAVLVAGEFEGRPMSRTASLTVGRLAGWENNGRALRNPTDGDGERLKIAGQAVPR